MAESHGAAGSATLARDLFRLLDKAIKLRRLYAHEHPVCRGILGELAAGFAAVLDEIPELSLTVTSKTLLVGNEVIHQDARGDASIPYRLFRDGVRLLQFVRGLTPHEIEQFIRVLETPPNDPGQFDENMATMLWRQGFEHIRHSAVDDIGTPGEGTSEDSVEAGAELTAGVELVFSSITAMKLPECSEGTAILSRVAADVHDVFEVNRQARATHTADEGGGDMVEVSGATLQRLRREVETDRMGNLILGKHFSISALSRNHAHRRGACSHPSRQHTGRENPLWTSYPPYNEHIVRLVGSL